LINFASQKLSGAGTAGTSPTGLGKVNALLVCCIKDVSVIGA
jgi:hypothetical protein